MPPPGRLLSIDQEDTLSFMRIAVDAMGSDNAPETEVIGAVQASLANSTLEVILVGDEQGLRNSLSRHPKHGNITIVHASERISMEETPVKAVRTKKDASLLVALRQVKEGKADAVVSMGNTGAIQVASRVILGRMKGVARSALCQRFPTLTKQPVCVLDLGANVDCTARHLCDFAEMGNEYAKLTLGLDRPRIGLVNIGEESAKGNEISKAVHRSLSAAPHLNFIGNVEPKSIFSGVADVVVCDGFVGNVILKTAEGTALLVAALLKEQLYSTIFTKIGALLSIGAYRRLKKISDPNEYGGAPLLGVNGIVTKVHGSGSALGVKNGILAAAEEVAGGLNGHIVEGIRILREAEARLKDLNGDKE